jgi:hypothetical protein
MDTEGVLQDVFQAIEPTQGDAPSDFVLVTVVPFQGEINLATNPLNYCKYEAIESFL